MSTRASRRLLRAAAVAVVALLLPACAGLPTSGDVAVGLELGESPDDVDVLPVASGPIAGAGPEEIVEGIREAGIATPGSWATAREFLAPSLQRSWRPSAGVSIDAGAEARTLTSNVADDQVEDADEAEVQVLLELLASVDDSGAYSGAPGDSSIPFALARDEDGEWRITQAPDGVVIDEARFPNVFEGYSLQWFDAGWSRLVPDIRWFPRRQSPATTVTQALVAGTPAEWLDPAVQTAFPADVQLAQDAVLITAQVAEVSLTRPAAGLDRTTLARMRTQLQATLRAAGVNVTQVRFSVDGRALDAGVVELADSTPEPGTLVLKDGVFGRIVGDEIASIPAISPQIQSVSQPIEAIDVAADDASAALQLDDGHVYLVGKSSRDELDARPGLVQPSLDPYGYVWSVPAGAPQAVQAVGPDVVAHKVAGAWPSASSISDLRVAADGARVAAVIVVGGQRWLAVASVVRDGSGVPTDLGEMRPLLQLTEASTGLAWLGPDRLAVLTDSSTPRLLVQPVGGPGSAETAPSDAASVAGARTPAGVRILDADGQLFAHAGSAWREVAEGVAILATRAGE